MPYTIGSIEFDKKEHITSRCQQIRDKTPDGEKVSPEDFDFLIALFRHHDEWLEKSYPGVEAISTQTTEHGTRGFILIRTEEFDPIDISFPHSIKLIPSCRGAKLTPQKLLDFKDAARTAVQGQIRGFRDCELLEAKTCPINGTPLARGNCDVYYPLPNTFERLLLDFTLEQGLRPLDVAVDSVGNTAKFRDEEVGNAWAAYHRQHAKLQLVSSQGRLTLPKQSTDWTGVL